MLPTSVKNRGASDAPSVRAEPHRLGWRLIHRLPVDKRHTVKARTLTSTFYDSKEDAENEMEWFQKAIAKDKGVCWISPHQRLEVKDDHKSQALTKCSTFLSSR